MDQLKQIIEIMKEGDAHFVLATGSNDDWIAFIQKDESPDEPYCWEVGSDPESVIALMLAKVV